RPEERHTVGAGGAGEGPLEAGSIIDVGLDDFRAELCECAGLIGVDIAGERAGGKAARLVAHDRAHYAAALRAGGSDDGDDLLLRHCGLPWQVFPSGAAAAA